MEGGRLVFKGLVASTKTPCYAPCLLNRAQLICVCLGCLFRLFGDRLLPSSPLFSPLPGHRLAQGHLDWTHGCWLTYILQWKTSWPLRQSPLLWIHAATQTPFSCLTVCFFPIRSSFSGVFLGFFLVAGGSGDGQGLKGTYNSPSYWIFKKEKAIFTVSKAFTDVSNWKLDSL